MMSYIPSSIPFTERLTAPLTDTHTEYRRWGVSQLSHLHHKSHSASMISQCKLVDASEMFLLSGNWERLV